MLSHISINKQQEYTCVEELGHEYSIGNGRQLLAVGVFSYPLNTFDDHIFQNYIDSNDDE